MKIRKKKEKLITTAEHKRNIRNRIGLIIFFLILITGSIAFNLYHQGSRTWSSIDSNLYVFFLININLILLITFVLLIIRNLVKLIYERKKRKLGFRLKFKLTLAFILISSLPMLLLFFITNGFLTNTLDFWFEGQFSVVLKNSATVIKNYDRTSNEELKHFGKMLARDYITNISQSPPVVDPAEQMLKSGLKVLTQSESQEKEFQIQRHWVNRSLEQFGLSGIIFYNKELIPVKVWFADDALKAIWKPLDAEVMKNIQVISPITLNTREKTGQITRALVPLTLSGEQYFLEATKILTGSDYKDLTTVLKNLKDHRNFLSLERPIRANYTAYLMLFTLLIIFGGTWFGYYLARSIVEPIETLVDGTRRISKGDLDFQIDLQVDDEIHMLLDSFNAMTKELQQNRKKLAQSQESVLNANKILEERNIFVELVLQNIQSGIFLVDNSGFVKGINPYMIKLFKIKLPKTVTKHYRSVFNKEQVALFDDLSNKLSDPHITFVSKDVHVKLGKKTIHVSMELFQLKNIKGEQLGKLLVVNDLTELDRSTRARAWREVARRIAHEIKNPLTPIQLSAQRIRRNYLARIENGKLLDNCTSTIINEVYGLKNMVNEFSKFARLPEINSSPMSINQILEDVCNLFKPGLPSAIKLKLITDPHVPRVLLDSEQMKRVFTNLIDNAVAAMEEGGDINISSQYSEDLKMVTISVADTGSGISEDMIHRVFDPYVTTKKQGTGLGLAIVQQIIADHNGFIRVENGKEFGAKFTIELPA